MWQNRIFAFFKSEIQSGKFSKVLDKVQLIDVQKGHITAEMILTKECCNRRDFLHGGMSATLIDSLTSLTLMSHFEADNLSPPNSVSIELAISFLSAIPENNTIRLESELLKIGKNLAFLSANIYNKENNKLAVIGKHTKFLL